MVYNSSLQKLELYLTFLNELHRYNILNKWRNIYTIYGDKNNFKFVSDYKNSLDKSRNIYVV